MTEPTNIVTQESLTFVNNSTPLTMTTKELDLDTCYSPTEIVIKMKSISLNPVDFLTYHNASKWMVPSCKKTIGRDYAGEIVRKGSKVEPKWQIGDLVCGFFNHVYGERGTFSNYLVIDISKQQAISHLIKFENESDEYNQFDLNASIPLVFGTAYAVLFRQGQKWGPDSKILVNGASTAVSNCFIQIAKNFLNIGTVVGICNSNSFDYNKKAGFDKLIAYDKGNTVEQVQDIIDEEFKGEKFDLIFDSVGTSQFFPIIEDLLKPRSENSYYITIAGNGKLDYKAGILSSIKTVPFGNILSSYNPRRLFNYSFLFAKSEVNFMDLASRMAEKGQFSPVIDSVYEFKDYEKAIERALSNKAKGKIIVRFSNE